MDTTPRQPFVPYTTNMKVETVNKPESLCYALQGLTVAQNSGITDMGFESIKSFNIDYIPERLGYWLLVNYDHKRNELNIGNRIIKITPSKVHDVLGIPMGKIPVTERRKPRKGDAFRNEWRKQSFPHIITVRHVIEKLKSYTEGGTLFKVNFLVVFNSIMGETFKCSAVDHKFLMSVINERDICNMDWCSYIITCLKRTKEGWNGLEPYSGPLTFLAVLYAHELQMTLFPAIQYVTTNLLVGLESSMYNIGSGLYDDIEEIQFTQLVEVQVQLESHIESAEGQTDEGLTGIDQNVSVHDVASVHTDSVLNVKVPIGPPGAQSLTGLSANLGQCNRLEPPKDVILLDDDDDDDDDVIILDPKKEHCELVGKLSSCQSGTVCVQGYTVKKDVAKILEAIFKKHGDIASKCVLKTDNWISSILEAVCEVAKKIQANDVIEKPEDIEKQLLDAKAVNIDVSWLQAHLEAVRKRKELSEWYGLLMEMKANTVLVKKFAQINLRKRRAELVVAEERSKKAKRCVELVNLVGRNLIGYFFESKAKMDALVSDSVVRR